jgi:hypothetical protein
MSGSPRSLVVYFSRGEATRLVAEAIARASSAECEALHEARPRRGWLGWLRSGYASPGTLPLRHDLRSYDLVFVGSPALQGTLPSPMRSFFSAHQHELPNVALFVTHPRRARAEHVMAEMAELARKAPLAQLALLEADARRGPAIEVGELVETAHAAWERLPSSGKFCAARRAGLAGSDDEASRRR